MGNSQGQFNFEAQLDIADLQFLGRKELRDRIRWLVKQQVQKHAVDQGIVLPPDWWIDHKPDVDHITIKVTVYLPEEVSGDNPNG